MGFWQKVKDFGSKVVKGVRKGLDFVRHKIAPVVKKVWTFAKPAINTLVPGGSAFTSAAENIAGKVGSIIGV